MFLTLVALPVSSMKAWILPVCDLCCCVPSCVFSATAEKAFGFRLRCYNTCCSSTCKAGSQAWQQSSNSRLPRMLQRRLTAAAGMSEHTAQQIRIQGHAAMRVMSMKENYRCSKCTEAHSSGILMVSQSRSVQLIILKYPGPSLRPWCVLSPNMSKGDVVQPHTTTVCTLQLYIPR